MSDKPFELIHGDSICQIVFETLDKPCVVPYGSEKLGSKYQNSSGAVLSRYEKL